MPQYIRNKFAYKRQILWQGVFGNVNNIPIQKLMTDRSFLQPG